MRLPPGKIPIEILQQVVFKNLGAKRREVVLGPLAGFDGAVIDIEKNSIIVSTDPITGALDRIGWLAVNVNANDVATFGVEPAFFLSCIMLPEKANKKAVEIICFQMDNAAKALEIAIVGGHCETTPGLTNPIVAGCAMGITEKGNYVTAGGAEPGDKLILTKSAGIEGTAILAVDRRRLLKEALGTVMLQEASSFYDQVSVVREAVVAFRTGGVHAMHDPTEGGIAGGIHEMADASSLGVRIDEREIPIRHETAEICNFFKIDPLQLISSGALLISVEPESATKITKSLEQKRIPASIIGEFSESQHERVMMCKDKKTRALPRPLSDHLWLALRRR